MTIYGLYEPDGKYISGELEHYSEDAKKLADGEAAFYFRSDAHTILLGSAVRVQRAGKRQDLLIFFQEHPLQSDISLLLSRFFTDASDALTHSGYSILNIWGEEDFVQNLSLPLKPEHADPRIHHYLAGRIITGKPSYGRTSTFSKSLDVTGHVLQLFRPVLHLGYSCAISRDIIDRVNPPDLTIFSFKPYNQVYTDLDSNLVDDPASDLFTRYGKVLANSANSIRIQRDIITSKEKLCKLIEHALIQSLSDPHKKRDFYTRMKSGGIRRLTPFTIEEIVYDVTSKGDTTKVEEFFAGSYKKEVFAQYLTKFSADEPKKYLVFYERIKSIVDDCAPMDAREHLDKLKRRHTLPEPKPRRSREPYSDLDESWFSRYRNIMIVAISFVFITIIVIIVISVFMPGALPDRVETMVGGVAGMLPSRSGEGGIIYTTTGHYNGSESGEVSREVRIQTENGGAMLTIPIGTKVQDRDGSLLSSLTIRQLQPSEVPTDEPSSIRISERNAVEITPEGATFDSQITLLFTLSADLEADNMIHLGIVRYNNSTTKWDPIHNESRVEGEVRGFINQSGIYAVSSSERD